MPARMIRKGDSVLLRGKVTRISEDGVEITVMLKAFGYPITLRTDAADNVERQSRVRPRKQADDAD
jgi:hypothetical protein